MSRAALLLALLGVAAPAAGAPRAAAAPQPPRSTSDLARGFRAYRAGDYAAAIPALTAAAGHGLRADDWALFLLGESRFYVGDYRAARGHFERVARGKGRPAEMAPFRMADCLWMEGAREKAAAAYARLLKRGAAGPFGDPAVARFHLAEVTADKDRANARRQFVAIAKDLPAHPLADEALKRAAALGPEAVAAPAASVAAGAPELSPADRLRRAESLTRERHWDEALVELAKVPATVPSELAVERDYQIGMTKFHMRRDYARAAELLLAAAPKLAGDKAAEAAFHGARALSRVDRDDEAIAGYRKVVTQYPRSRWAAEAQYLSGWLDYNRGRFRESLAGLQATLDRFGKSPFADDAAWCVAFAHFMLGEADAAAAGLARYERMPATGMTSDERATQVAYWRARLQQKGGHKEEAQRGYRELARRAPLSFYGLLATARLDEGPPPLPDKRMVLRAPAHPERDSVIARFQELVEAGLTAEAGWELERAEKGVLERAGGEKALGWLLGLYARAGDFHRAYQLAEAHGGGALAAQPRDGARVYWEAAYPRAYSGLVEAYGPAAGNPDVLLYAIMRKESGFNPLDVSYADARGLLQMIPPTSARVAAGAKLPFYPDQLYEPETNVRLGAIYIGSLFKKFGAQVPLTAGAYNAGPRAMARWCEQHGQHPTDEFVELIAFAQTREYVKRVTSLYARYRFLYGPAPYRLPLALDARVKPEGPDY